MKTRTLLLLLTALLFNTLNLQAHMQRFAYSNGLEILTKGEWEIETYATWKHFDNKDRFDFRHELEYGLTDNLMVALYLANWRYERFDGGDDKTTYQSTALEMIYVFTNPNTSPIGSGIYAEAGLGDKKAFIEAKLLLQKNIGAFAFVYNFKIEAEWEGSSLKNLDEKKGEFANTAGVSYQINPSFLIGAEILHEFEIEDWSDKTDDYLFFGPNISLRKGNLYLTSAALFDVLDKDSAPNSQVRIIAGVEF